jgi:hypothetical protein
MRKTRSCQKKRKRKGKGNAPVDENKGLAVVGPLLLALLLDGMEIGHELVVS